MSDDRLRSLERAARAEPNDGAAGQALARAYELAGERRRALLEQARLARQGQADARAALDAWAPRPHPTAALIRRPAIGPQVRERTVTMAGAVLAARAVASDARLLLPTRTRLVALDPIELTEVWAAPGQAWPLALRGDDVLHAGGAGLVLRDGSDGAQLAEVALAGRVVDLFTWGDRAVVVHDAPGVRRVSAIDVGASPGRVLWTRDAPTGAVDLVRLVRQRVVMSGPLRLEVLDVETGRTAAARALSPAQPRAQTGERVATTDARGVVVVTADLAPTAAGVRVAEHDLSRLEPRWHVQEMADDVEVTLGDGVAALRFLRAGASTVVVVDRATGSSSRPEAPPAHVGLTWVDGAAYALEREAEAVSLAVHDARTLERRARHALPVGPDLVDVDAVPLAGAVIVVLAHRDRTVLVRLEPAPPS